MKTSCNIFVALAVIVLCISCTKIDRVYKDEQQEIALRPIGVPTVKAEGESEAYPDDEIFGLFACYADCPGGTAWEVAQAWPVSSVYFENAAFRKTGETWAGYDPSSSAHKPYYWPLQGSLMFTGYSPHSSQHEGSVVKNVTLHKGDTQDNNPYLEIAFTQKTTISEMVDLLWFDVKDVNAGKTLSKSANAVPVAFKHALSKVTLRFKDSKGRYQLKAVSMKGCINAGTFYSGKTAGWKPEVDALADYSAEIIPQTSDGVTTYPTLDGWASSDMLIIPQYLDGIFPTIGTGTLESGVDVVLEFTLTDGYGEQTVCVRMYDHTHQWEMGKHYTYTIAVDADKIEFGAPSVSITTQTVSM